MNTMTKFTDLPTDIVIDILCMCDYKSILRLSYVSKFINNIGLESILIRKSKQIQNIMGNTDHLVPISIILSSVHTDDDTIISCLKYLLSNNIDLACGDRVLTDRRGAGCAGAIGFTGYKGKTTTSRGVIVNPTYKIFDKFLKFELR